MSFAKIALSIILPVILSTNYRPVMASKTVEPFGEAFWEKISLRAEKFTQEVKKTLGIEERIEDTPGSPTHRPEAFWIDNFIEWLPHPELQVNRSRVNVQNAATRLVRILVADGRLNDTSELRDLITFFILDSPDFLDRKSIGSKLIPRVPNAASQAYDLSSEIFQDVDDFQPDNKTEVGLSGVEYNDRRFLEWCQDESREEDVRAYLGLLSVALMSSPGGEVLMPTLVTYYLNRIAGEMGLQTPPAFFHLGPLKALDVASVVGKNHLLFAQILRSLLERYHEQDDPPESWNVFYRRILRDNFAMVNFRMVFYLEDLFGDNNKEIREFVEDIELTNDDNLIAQARNYRKIKEYISFSEDPKLIDTIPFLKLQTLKLWKYSSLFSVRFFSSLSNYANYELFSVAAEMLTCVDKKHSRFYGYNFLSPKHKNLAKELYKKHLARTSGT